MIYKTIGTGGNYSTLKDFFDACEGIGGIDNTIYTGNMDVTILNDITETEWTTYQIHGKNYMPGQPNYAPYNFPYTMTIHGNSGQSGFFGGCTKVTLNSNGVYISPNGDNPAYRAYEYGTIIFKDIEFYYSGVYDAQFCFAPGVGTWNHFRIEVKNCLFNGVYISSGPVIGGLHNGGWYISNCKVYSKDVPLKFEYGNSDGSVVENCTFYRTSNNYTVKVDNSYYSLVLRNCVFNKNGSLSVFNGNSTNLTTLYCASEDSSLPSGTGNISSVVPANEFLSLDSTSVDFLKPKRAGSIYKGGTVPTLASTDIAGKTIPTEFGEYPIGCHVADGGIDFVGVPTSGDEPLSVQFTDLSTF